MSETTDIIDTETEVALSAYIDGELNPEEQADMEHRLCREPELRQRLDELRMANRILEHGFSGALAETRRHKAVPDTVGSMATKSPAAYGWTVRSFGLLAFLVFVALSLILAWVA